MRYPTETKEHAKARQAAGHKAKNMYIPVEEHYDDLGDYLSGLGGDLEWLAAAYVVENYEPNTSSSEEDVATGTETTYFHGAPAPPLSLPQHKVRDVSASFQALIAAGPGLDIC